MRIGTGVIVVAAMAVSAVAAGVATGQNASARPGATPGLIVPHESWSLSSTPGMSQGGVALTFYESAR